MTYRSHTRAASAGLLSCCALILGTLLNRPVLAEEAGTGRI